MRFPHIISKNTDEAYKPSQATSQLIGEEERKLFAESIDWDNELRPTLVTLCVEAISKKFAEKPILDELPCADRLHLLEILATDLPLELVVPLIEDEIYWQRRYETDFGMVLERKHPDCTWKCMFLEKYMQDKIEQAQPQYNDEDNMEDITKLICPFIHRLLITQLQTWKPPLTWDKEEIPEVYPTDHINLTPILAKLEHVEELSIIFGMKDVADSFTWNMFRLSVDDCKRLGRAVLTLQFIKILRIHRSKIEYFHCQALMQGLINNKTLIELDLSHCQIGDHGALCIAKIMTEHPVLERILLCNNKIGTIGGQGIGFVLLHETCCPLVHLDLRLNPLGHDGTMGIMRALVRGDRPAELNLSGCGFDDETSLRVAQMLRLNSTIRVLDASNNWFGEEAGEALILSLATNKTIEWLDLRETDVPENHLYMINKALRRNRLGLDEIEEDEVTESEVEEEQPEEIEQEIATEEPVADAEHAAEN